MKSLRILLCAAFFSFSLPQASWAQLSQLEFDTSSHKVSERETTIQQNSALLEEMTGDRSFVVKGLDTEAAEAKSGLHKIVIRKEISAEKASSRASFAGYETNLLGTEQQNFLIPSISGLKTDESDSSKITSKFSWKVEEGSSCLKPAGAENIKLKAQALSDIIERFTGDDFFSTSHCSNKCKTNQVALISKLKIQDMKGGKFSFHSEADRCHYQMEKPTSRVWQMVEATEVVCGCFN